MKVAIVNLGKIVSGDWRAPFATGDTIITEGERIVFRWGDSRVAWELADAPGGTRFIVTEHRFARDAVTWGPKLMALSSASALCLA